MITDVIQTRRSLVDSVLPMRSTIDNPFKGPAVSPENPEAIHGDKHSSLGHSVLCFRPRLFGVTLFVILVSLELHRDSISATAPWAAWVTTVPMSLFFAGAVGVVFVFVANRVVRPYH